MSTITKANVQNINDNETEDIHRVDTDLSLIHTYMPVHFVTFTISQCPQPACLHKAKGVTRTCCTKLIAEFYPSFICPNSFSAAALLYSYTLTLHCCILLQIFTVNHLLTVLVLLILLFLFLASTAALCGFVVSLFYLPYDLAAGINRILPVFYYFIRLRCFGICPCFLSLL